MKLHILAGWTLYGVAGGFVASIMLLFTCTSVLGAPANLGYAIPIAVVTMLAGGIVGGTVLAKIGSRRGGEDQPPSRPPDQTPGQPPAPDQPPGSP